MSSLRNTYDTIALPNSVFFSRRATDDGESENPGNSFVMTGNYSGAPKRFWVTPDADHRLDVASIQLLISDNGVLPDQKDYGNIANGLTEGVRFFIEDSDGIQYSDLRLKNNSDVVGFSDGFTLTEFGSNIRVIAYRRFFPKDLDDYKIYENAPSRFGVELNDDFTTLVEHTLWVNGSQRLARVAASILAALLFVVPFMHTGVII